MKYCESCRMLHNDEDESCSQCKKRLKTVEEPNTPVFLISASGFEKDRIIAALADEGIPSDTKRIKKDNSANAVTGVDMSDINILVPYQAYEKAYDICVGIGAIKAEDEEIVDDGQYKESSAKSLSEQFEETNGSGKDGRIVLAVMFLLVASLAIFGTDAIMNIIMKLFNGG